jgi:hypothetical protein
LADFQLVTEHYNPEDRTVHNHCSENLRHVDFQLVTEHCNPEDRTVHNHCSENLTRDREHVLAFMAVSIQAIKFIIMYISLYSPVYIFYILLEVCDLFGLCNIMDRQSAGAERGGSGLTLG